jgi:hypothetical protein
MVPVAQFQQVPATVRVEAIDLLVGEDVPTALAALRKSNRSVHAAKKAMAHVGSEFRLEAWYRSALTGRSPWSETELDRSEKPKRLN